jgi:hypothetical protein
MSENLDRSAAQGVAVRLDDPSRERLVGGGPVDLVREQRASQQVLDDLEAVGVSDDDVVGVPEADGTARFTTSGNELFEQLEAALQAEHTAA